VIRKRKVKMTEEYLTREEREQGWILVKGVRTLTFLSKIVFESGATGRAYRVWMEKEERPYGEEKLK